MGKLGGINGRLGILGKAEASSAGKILLDRRFRRRGFAVLAIGAKGPVGRAFSFFKIFREI